MTQRNTPVIYEFGGFRLDPSRRILFGLDGEPIALKPKVFDTLLHFVEHGEGLVDKAALMKAVWGDVIVEENSLNQHVSMLRHALGEVPGENRFIVTIPGRGYRFVARVRTVASTSQGSAPAVNALQQAPERRDPAADASPARSANARYVAAGLGAAALLTLLAWYGPGRQAANQDSAGADVVRFEVPVASGAYLSGGLAIEEFALQRPSRPSFALSPDGRYLVYAATDGETSRLYRRAMDQQDATLIPGTEGASQPFFSPDSLSVGFLVDDGVVDRALQLKRVAIGGGDVRTIAVTGAELSPLNLPPSWTENDTILVSAERGIYELSANGGQLVQLTEGTAVVGGIGYTDNVYPQMLPGRRAVLFNAANGATPSEWDIVVETLDGAERKVVVHRGSHPRYVPSGHIVFARGGALLAVPFDLMRLEVTSAPVVVVEHVLHGEGGTIGELNAGAAQFSVSNAGSLAYVPGGTYPEVGYSLVFVDRGGHVEPLPLSPAVYQWPRFSPDGTRLSYGVGVVGQEQIWVYDLASQIPLRITHDGHNASPVWSPDSDRFTFYRDGDLVSMAADGGDEPRRIAAGVDTPVPSSWIRNVLAFVEGDGTALWTLRMDDNSAPERFLHTSAAPSRFPELSPDGKWLAYASTEESQPDVYVRPFPQGAPRYRVSNDVGVAPVWSHDGRELYYLSPGTEHRLRVMVVQVVADPVFTTTRPTPLFEGEFGGASPTRAYDISPDDQRFVFATVPLARAPEPATRINVVLNWSEELKERAPRRPN